MKGKVIPSARNAQDPLKGFETLSQRHSAFVDAFIHELAHVEIATQKLNVHAAVREMRKHIGWYLKGLKNSAKYRDQINKITDCP